MLIIKKEHITFLILSGFLLRIVVALINSFISPTMGAEADALGFHQVAYDFAITGDKEIDDITRPGWTYSLVLGYIYRYFFDSIFFGCILSVFAWLLTVFVVIRLLDHLRFDNYSKFYSVLILAFLPSSVFYTSVTLRESYQMLFVICLLYSMVRFYKTNSLLHFLCIPIFCFLAATLHKALIAYSFASIALFTIFTSLINMKKKFTKVRFYMVTVIVVSLIPLALSIFQQYGYGTVAEEGLISAVASFQEGAIPDALPRAHYRSVVIETNLFSFLLFFPTAFIQYQLEPFPWNIGSFADFFFFFENILRVYLIYVAASYLLKSRGKFEDKNNASILFIFLAYLLLEFLWALGTVNWGTASRHHLPSLGLLVVASAYSFKPMHKRLFLKHVK